MSRKTLEAHGRHRQQTPRWVKVSGIVAAVLVALFAILHLTGNDMRQHGRHRAPEAAPLPSSQPR